MARSSAPSAAASPAVLPPLLPRPGRAGVPDQERRLPQGDEHPRPPRVQRRCRGSRALCGGVPGEHARRNGADDPEVLGQPQHRLWLARRSRPRRDHGLDGFHPVSVARPRIQKQGRARDVDAEVGEAAQGGQGAAGGGEAVVCALRFVGAGAGPSCCSPPRASGGEPEALLRVGHGVVRQGRRLPQMLDAGGQGHGGGRRGGQGLQERPRRAPAARGERAGRERRGDQQRRRRCC